MPIKYEILREVYTKYREKRLILLIKKSASRT